jgi:DNA-binding CsgD family transcriptional regulator
VSTNETMPLTRMVPLTRKQRRTKNIIAELTEANEGTPPSARELAEVLNISIPAVYHLIRGIMDRGHATKVRFKPHTLQLVEELERA